MLKNHVVKRSPEIAKFMGELISPEVNRQVSFVSPHLRLFTIHQLPITNKKGAYTESV